MELFRNIVVTHIEPPKTIFSAWGRTFEMANRPSYGLSLCRSGQITYVMDGKKYLSTSAHAILLPKGGCYTLYGDKEGLFPLINFQCENLPLDTIRVLPMKNPQAYQAEYEAFSTLFLFSNQQLKFYSSFYTLLDHLARDQHPENDLLEPAIHYIHAHLSDSSLTNEALAGISGISEVYFRKLFQAQYHITPKQYILNIRLQAAQELLTSSDASISIIAEKCGFSSLYHFCRIFKQKTGTTPTQYARENRSYKI